MKRTATRLAILWMCTAGVCAAQQPQSDPHAVGVLFASDASVRGSMVMTAGGTSVMSGSQVGAGTQAAVLKLARGGEVRICPGTSVAVSQQTVKAPMMFGVNTGAMEIQYKLESVSDSVITPDFRIQLIGPGTFHLAIGAAKNGDTCVRSLPGQNAAVIVSEMMGEGTYQVAAGWSVIFKEGKLKEVYSSDAPCGCPAPKPEPAQVAKDVPLPTTTPQATQAQVVEMEAPLVFKGKPTDDEGFQQQRVVATLRMRPLQMSSALLPSQRVEMKTAKAPEKKGFFGKLGAWFGRVFGKS